MTSYNKEISLEYLNYSLKDEMYLSITTPILKEILESQKTRLKTQADIAKLFFDLRDEAWAEIKKLQSEIGEIKTKRII